MATFKYRMLNHLYALDKTTGSVRIGHAVAVMRTDAPLNQKCTSNSAFIQMYDGKTGYGQFNKWKFDWTGSHANNVQNEWVNLLAIPNNGEGLDLDTVWYRSDTTLSSTSSQTVDVWFGFQSNSGMGNTKQLCKRTLFLPRLGSESTVATAASSYDIGATAKINITSEETRYVHTVKYKIGSSSGTIATNTTSRTIDWVIPTTFYDQITNSTSATVTITVETLCPYFYSEGTDADTSQIYKTLSLGTKETTFTVNVPASIKPTIGTVTLSDMDTTIRGASNSIFIKDGVTDTNGGFVSGKSVLSVAVQAYGKNGSVIRSVSLSMPQVGNTTVTDSTTVGDENNVYTIDTMRYLYPENFGTKANTITITATDSRGRTATKTVNYYAGQYMPASINQFDVYRCDSSGAEKNDGTYLHIELDLNTGYGQQGVKLRDQASSYFKISYKKTTETTYTQLVNSSTGASSFTIKNASGTTITAASLKGVTPLYANMISTSAIMDPLEAYEFKLETFSYESITTTARLGTTFVLMDFGANGKSIALGQISSHSEDNDSETELEINMPMTIKTNPGRDTYVQPHYGVCSTAAATGAKTVSIPGFRLTDGADVYVKFTVANTAGVADLTLNVQNTGAKHIKRIGTTDLSAKENLAKNGVYHFIYDGANWLWVSGVDRDTNADHYERLKISNYVKAQSAVTAGEIMVGTSSGYNPIAEGRTFDISYPILYANAAITANGTTTGAFLRMPGVNLTNNIGGWTGTAYSMVYLVLSSIVGTTATICSDPDVEFLTTTKPTTANGLYYIPLGIMYTTTQCFFCPSNDIYTYTFGKFRKYPTVRDVTFSETLTSNSGVSPYSYYKNINIKTYIDTYGAPLSATATDNSGVPVPCAFKADGNGDYLCVVAKTANVNVRLKFA